MPPRIVRTGEHLDVIAHRHGVTVEEIWSKHPNGDLKGRRPGGHMLLEGDYLELPPRRHPEPVDVAVGGDTVVVATIPRVKVELTLSNGEGPLRGEPWRIEARGERAEGTTGADGKVSFEVRVTTPRVVLVLSKLGIRRDIAVGALDPNDTISGVIHRLNNLGYDAGPAASTLDERAVKALVQFQTANQLTPSGQPDEATMRALETVHGS